jgi:hypothetical protein
LITLLTRIIHKLCLDGCWAVIAEMRGVFLESGSGCRGFFAV